jgi:integrase
MVYDLAERRAPSIEALTSDVLADVAELRVIAREAADASRAPSTEKAYASDWRDFSAFATRVGRERMPADSETVALYVAELRRSGRRPATIARKLAAIAVYHRSAGHPSPCEHDVVRAVVRGTRRALGVAQRQSTALSIADLTRVLAPIGRDPRGLRDRALLLVGFAAALRRSELVAIDFEDLWFEEGRGVVIRIRRSKTDQESAGDDVSIALGSESKTCPVTALRDWLWMSGITSGPVFRRVRRGGAVGSLALTGYAVAQITAVRAADAGLEGDFAGHSLRSGFATAAARAGSSERAIMRHGRWKDSASARRYIRDGNRWEDNPTSTIGL